MMRVVLIVSERSRLDGVDSAREDQVEGVQQSLEASPKNCY